MYMCVSTSKPTTLKATLSHEMAFFIAIDIILEKSISSLYSFGSKSNIRSTSFLGTHSVCPITLGFMSKKAKQFFVSAIL